MQISNLLALGFAFATKSWVLIRTVTLPAFDLLIHPTVNNTTRYVTWNDSEHKRRDEREHCMSAVGANSIFEDRSIPYLYWIKPSGLYNLSRSCTSPNLIVFHPVQLNQSHDHHKIIRIYTRPSRHGRSLPKLDVAIAFNDSGDRKFCHNSWKWTQAALTWQIKVFPEIRFQIFDISFGSRYLPRFWGWFTDT
jgi:hypothetical protein